MRKTLSLLLVLMLLCGCCAVAEEAAAFQPISWDLTVSPNTPNEANYLPNDTGYHDDSLDIGVTTFRADNGTLVYAIRVKITDPSQIRTGTQSSRPPYTSTALVSVMAKRFGAVLAINDDYFGLHNEGIVVRNTKMIRNRPTTRRDQLIIDDKGDFHIMTGTTKAKWEAWEGNVIHTLCFGPGLVVDGVKNSECAKTKMNVGPNNKTQRIAIGQVAPLEYLILATDGPDNEKGAGLTLQEMADLCYQQGMINAYNLDGGSSSTVVLNNHKINAKGSQVRKVGGCVWFATLVPNQ